MKELINHPEYLKQLIQNKDMDLVKIITESEDVGKILYSIYTIIIF